MEKDIYVAEGSRVSMRLSVAEVFHFIDAGGVESSFPLRLFRSEDRRQVVVVCDVEKATGTPFEECPGFAADAICTHYGLTPELSEFYLLFPAACVGEDPRFCRVHLESSGIDISKARLVDDSVQDFTDRTGVQL